MPYGKHKGVEMQDVPATYLMWMYDNKKLDRAVSAYVEENMDVLQKEIDEGKNN